MATPIEAQFIAGKDGKPEYAVIPFQVFQTFFSEKIRQKEERKIH